MIIRMKSVKALDNYRLLVVFDDGKTVEYDMKDHIHKLPNYSDLETIYGLWQQVRLDESRTWACWNEYIDVPGDVIYERGVEIV